MNLLLEIWEFLTSAEAWQGVDGIPQRLLTHLWVSLTAVGFSAVVAIPPALWLGHHGYGRSLVTAVANLSRAIPSLAILALVVALGGGIGFLPTWVAMVALAIPPIFIGTLTGVSSIDPQISSAAHAMGLRPLSVITSVEWPLSLPMVISGVRVATSQVIATATLGAFVGYNTLGRFITVGRANRDDGMLYVGILIIVVTAVAFDTALRHAQARAGRWRDTKE